MKENGLLEKIKGLLKVNRKSRTGLESGKT